MDEQLGAFSDAQKANTEMKAAISQLMDMVNEAEADATASKVSGYCLKQKHESLGAPLLSCGLSKHRPFCLPWLGPFNAVSWC